MEEKTFFFLPFDLHLGFLCLFYIVRDFFCLFMVSLKRSICVLQPVLAAHNKFGPFQLVKKHQLMRFYSLLEGPLETIFICQIYKLIYSRWIAHFCCL